MCDDNAFFSNCMLAEPCLATQLASLYNLWCVTYALNRHNNRNMTYSTRALYYNFKQSNKINLNLNY